MRVGSLFSGYGGLDLAVGGDLAWYSEIEPAACRVLEAHHPNVPNLGDVTAVRWADLPPVDVITAGYPCQPFSTAGQRKGTDDERHLWPHVRDAIRELRPRYAILENVRGHITLGLDVVLADLAELGVSARWGLIRASDAGAPHSRARVFIVVTPQDTCGIRGRSARQTSPLLDTERTLWPLRSVRSNSCGATADPDRDGYGSQLHAAGMAEVEGQAEGSAPERQRSRGESDAGGNGAWAKYGPAIERWEHVLGRPAPAPAVGDRNERPTLNPVFVEWMMGLPKGWVTGHGLSRAQELKMLGNGVCPQQARLAMQLLGGPR